MPERRESSDRDIWPSWVLGERSREMARWRSSNESLMWSASRKSWAGFVDIAGSVVGSRERVDSGKGWSE